MLPNTNLNNKKFILSKSPEIIVKLKDEILYGGYFAALSGPAFIITVVDTDRNQYFTYPS